MNLITKDSNLTEQYNDLNSLNNASITLTDNFPIEKNTEKLQIKENMTDREIVMLLFKNSFWIIWSQFILAFLNNITLEVLGNLNLEKQSGTLMPFIFIGDIYSIYAAIGYGIIFSSFYFNLKYANRNKNEEFGNYTIYSIILILIFSTVLFFIIFFFSDYFMPFSENHLGTIIKKHLLIGHFYTIFHLINTSFMLLLFVKNLNFYSAIFDTITCISYFLIMKFYFEVKYCNEITKQNNNNTFNNNISNSVDINDLNNQNISNDKVKIQEEIYLTIAWILNLLYLLQFILYISFFIIKRPFKETKILSFKRYLKGFWFFSIYSFDFILIGFFNLNFTSDLNLLFINSPEQKILKISGYKISQGIIYIIQKISIGYFFALVKISKNLKVKRLNGFLSKLIKLYFYFTIPIVLFFAIFIFILGDFLPTLFSNDINVKSAMVEYLRVMIFIILPFHFEISMRGVLISYKKKRFLTYVYFTITVLYNFPLGLILSRVYNLDNISIYISAYSTEIFLGLIFFYYVRKLKSYEAIDEEKYSIISV
jgi:Na+-driven multidrug efflux pump